MVYTGRGDKGRTDLASGERVSKSSARIEAYGTVDELNSLTGVIASKSDRKRQELEQIQNDLHIIQAELADMQPEKKVTPENIERLEQLIDRYQEEVPRLEDFIISGGSEVASNLHLARSVARRAERRIVELDEQDSLRSPLLSYINRLSDLYFLMARHENFKEGIEEKTPDY